MYRAAPRVVVLAALLGLVFVPLGAGAQDPSAPAEVPTAPANQASSASGLEISADLHPAYLAGHPLVVTVKATNPGTESLDFPKLEERPHLVSFELVSSSGKKQTRFSTPPDEDEDLRWSLAPRASRQVAVELPSAATLQAGTYQLTVAVTDGDERIAIGPVSVVLESPRPVAADVPDGGSAALGWQLPWVHQGSAGHTLYLLTVPADRPDSRGYQWQLADLPGLATPTLALGRPSDGGSRYLYWRSGDRSLSFARLEERRLRHQPRTVSLPYPRWEPLARAGGDAASGLHVPVWIPAPTGSAGEVRVISIDTRGQPRFRKVAAFDSAPQASTWVDGAGRLRLLLLHGGELDLYTLDTGAEQELPAVGRRLIPQPVRADQVQLFAAPISAGVLSGTGALVSDHIADFVAERLAPMAPPPVQGIAFGELPERGDQPGGGAVFVWLADPEASVPSVAGVWMSTNGRIIATVPGASLPAGHRVARVLPRGYDPVVLVSLDRRGVSWAHCASWEAPVQLGTLAEGDGLRLDDQGRLWLVRMDAQRGLRAELVR
jgi:hypothetical protein